LTREIQACDLCPRGNLMPVLGSGHPQADIMLLKCAPVPSEIEEGVAFYGRAGSALMKSFKRLGIDPLAVYGTVFVKCPVADTDLAAPECRARVMQELAIVAPRMVVVMGDEALEELNDIGVPLGRRIAAGSRRPRTRMRRATTRSLTWRPRSRNGAPRASRSRARSATRTPQQPLRTHAISPSSTRSSSRRCRSGYRSG